MKVFLAVDLGAGSGRVLAGRTDFESLELEDVHRFENPATDLPGGLVWNPVGLHREILHGLRLAVRKYGDRIAALGIDTWGVDFALLDAQGRLLGLPHQYRDPRTDGMEEECERRFGNARIYASTGIMPFFLNTSHQLVAEAVRGGAALTHASHLVMMPDLFAYWLTGRIMVERTNASTTQLFSPATNDWAWDVIEGLGLPRRIFGEVVAPGTPLGELRPEVAAEVGGRFPVIATATHDTAAAVAGIPGEGNYAFLSSGTWSIIGAELPEPILTDEAFTVGWANELGVEGTTRFLRNISGGWLFQECQRHWAGEGEELSFDELSALAGDAEAFTAFVDPDHDDLASPGNMPSKIAEFCRRTGQPVPASKGSILRVAVESIALKHRIRFRQLRDLTGRDLDRIHMGGGGSRNTLLTQAIADACQTPVHAGPVEATACGNLIVQMVATGDLPDIAAGRRLIARAEPPKIFEPQRPESWNEPAARFAALLKTDD
ncbi:MAG: rhamnulokinase [Akkermansiaceae bacterium]|nr:rhamnulokinase [Akkermansiaceae bacterium]